jgi:hypothetical protein
LSQWRSQYGAGLPVGPTASYLLAEAALLDVDRRLQDDGVDFVRYVDDYSLFAPDMAAARRSLDCLIGSLAAAGLSLNGAKTSIESVTRSAYEDYLNSRRAGRFWGGLRSDKTCKMLAEDATTSPQKPPDIDKKAKQPKPPKPMKPFPSEYIQSPFRKSQLNEFDMAILRNVEPAGALADLTALARSGGRVSLGQFRVFTEAACYHGHHAMIGNVLDILDDCPHCIPYLVDVLMTERDQLPASACTAAADWFAARLLSGPAWTDFELMSVAMLLGAEGYRRPEAVFTYLVASSDAPSPIVTRVFVNALRGCCNRETADALVDLALRSEPVVRRAILDLSWQHLDSARQRALLEMYAVDFERDPFLRNLLRVTNI